jgi:phosphate transport system permease protein
VTGAARGAPHRPPPTSSLTARRPGRAGEHAFRALCALATYLPLAILGWLLVDVAVTGLARLDWQFLTSPPSRDPDRAGIYPALMGSLWLIGLTALVALPIGIAAAVYLEEYGRRGRLAAAAEIAIANLAGVPSIIYGLLGLGLFVRALALGETVIAGALTLALLVLPVVIMSTREALRSVDDGLREAALGLGATRWQATRRVVLPSALPGILTGTILAVSRAIGETAPLVMVGAVAYVAWAPDGVDAEYTALPMQIYRWTSMPQREFLANAAAGIVVLMATLLLLNGAAILLRNRARR